jgi:hypothetical protein
MTLLHPSNNTLRRYSLALLGLLVVAGKAFGLALTSEDLALTLGFLSATIVTSNWREVRAGKPPEVAP